MRRFPFLAALSACILLAACRGATEPPAVPASGSPRIVSLAPSVTDILVALGAGPGVVGTCAVQGRRSALPGIPEVAGFGTLDAERIVALRPTICATVRGMQDPQAISDLRRLGVGVVEYPVDTLDQLWACMGDLGGRVGKSAEGTALAEECRARVARAGVSAGEPRPAAAVLLGADPTVVAGGGTLLDEILRAAGFRNAVAALRGYPQMDAELLARSGIEVLIFPEGDLPEGAAQAVAETLRRIRHEKPSLLGVEADLLVRPGPRTPEAVERLAHLRESLRREQAGGSGP